MAYPGESLGPSDMARQQQQEQLLLDAHAREMQRAQHMMQSRESGVSSVAQQQQIMGGGQIGRQMYAGGASNPLMQHRAMQAGGQQGSQMLGQSAAARGQEMAEAQRGMMGAQAHRAQMELGMLGQSAAREQAARDADTARQQAELEERQREADAIFSIVGGITGGAGAGASAYGGG